MAKAKIDITAVDLKVATKPLYAGVGVTDLAVGAVRDYVSDVQKNVRDFDFQPKALRDQALTVVSNRVDALAADAKARRAAVETRVAELQAEALSYPAKVQSTVETNVSAATETYDGLVKRGEALVTRIRKQEATQAATANARTTTAKAKTTGTQAKKTGAATKKSATTTARTTGTAAKKSASTAAKKTTTTAKRSAATSKKAPAKKASTTASSAKATGTAARKTASSAAQATTAAAAKVGD